MTAGTAILMGTPQNGTLPKNQTRTCHPQLGKLFILKYFSRIILIYTNLYEARGTSTSSDSNLNDLSLKP